MCARGPARDSDGMPSGGPHDQATGTCAICARAIEGPALADHASARVFHPECVVAQAPEDALIRLLGFLALIATPTVLLWAA